MEPTPTELSNIVSLASLLDFAGVVDTPYDASTTATDLSSPRSDFFKHVGMGAAHHYRLLAVLPTKDFELGIASLQMNGNPMNMGQRASLLLAHATARCMCSLDQWPSQARLTTIALAAAPAPAPIPSTAGGVAGGLVNTPTIKMNRILDQTSPAEITFLPHPEYQKMYDSYVRIMQVPPSEDEACTMEQLSALKHVMLQNRAPFADFSLFGPHGTRTFKKVMLCGLTMDSAGAFQHVELFGPPTLEAWLASYDVLATALLMLEAVSRPALAVYRKKIATYHAQYGGPKIWHLLYQADVRCRQEHMEALNFRLAAAHTAAVSQFPPLPSTYDVAKPWDSVWSETVGRDDTDWWKKEFETPAILIVTRIQNLSDSIGGDAPIQQGRANLASVHAQAVAQAFQGSGAQGSRNSPPAPTRPTKIKKTKKAQQSSGSGMATNRSGKRLCDAFQNGRCSETLPNGVCANNPSEVHQCSRCLQPSHGAFSPKHCQNPMLSAKTSKKGKGKGNRGK